MMAEAMEEEVEPMEEVVTMEEVVAMEEVEEAMEAMEVVVATIRRKLWTKLLALKV